MKISANNISIEDAFTGVLSVVAMTIQNFAEGHIVTDVSPSAVILKSDDRKQHPAIDPAVNPAKHPAATHF